MKIFVVEINGVKVLVCLWEGMQHCLSHAEEPFPGSILVYFLHVPEGLSWCQNSVSDGWFVCLFVLWIVGFVCLNTWTMPLSTKLNEKRGNMGSGGKKPQNCGRSCLGWQNNKMTSETCILSSWSFVNLIIWKHRSIHVGILHEHFNVTK